MTPESVSPRTPPANAAFWMTLLGACAFGETAGDLLSHGLKLGYLVSSLILGAFFVAAMVAEFRAEGYREARFWTALAATATVGTTLADLCSRTLELGYARSSAFLVAGLVATLFAFRGRSGRVQEAGYWLAILFVSTLGTTLGDFLSNDSGLGFGGASVVLGLLIPAVLAIRHRGWVPDRAGYWTAILLTSTFGAAAGDFLTKPEGLKLGPFLGTLVLAVGLAVILLATRRARLAGATG